MDIIFKTKIITASKTYEPKEQYTISDVVAKKIGMFGDILAMEKQNIDTTSCKIYRDYFYLHHKEYK